jgi:hypothetical protein
MILASSEDRKAYQGRATAQAVSRRFPPRRPGFNPTSSLVGFVLGKVALGHVFFYFPC